METGRGDVSRYFQMTETRFWELYEGMNREQKDWIDAEIARIRVYDYDCENVGWEILISQARDLFE